MTVFFLCQFFISVDLNVFMLFRVVIVESNEKYTLKGVWRSCTRTILAVSTHIISHKLYCSFVEAASLHSLQGSLRGTEVLNPIQPVLQWVHLYS